MSEVKLYLGDCLEVMKSIPDKSVDSVVTDPPYELGFMGKAWDASGIAYSVVMWSEVLRVLKPGGHLLAFGGTRTYHRMACAIEDAGFEIRDMAQWLYGQGFPKSYNISKGINAKQRVGTCQPQGLRKARMGEDYEPTGQEDYRKGRMFEQLPDDEHKEILTDDAQQWDGWGSALKPANEPICLARKPLSEKTIVENVLKWGTGGMNIDGCRVDANGEAIPINVLEEWSGFGQKIRPDYKATQNTQGRFPANLILDEEAGRMLDEQSGESKSSSDPYRFQKSSGGWKSQPYGNQIVTAPADKGGASRFFYCAKSSRSERNAGLEGMEEKENLQGLDVRGRTLVREDGSKALVERWKSAPSQNHHPTVKPISLMRYLCRLITPPNGTVLDPFMGSGTTGCGCVMEGFDFIGIERDAEYIEIARRRIEHWSREAQQQMRLEI